MPEYRSKQMEAKKLLVVEHVSKSFLSHKKNKIHAVRDVSLFVREGECLGILGESGCGKSTLAKMIAGIHPIDQGRILLNEVCINDFNKKEQRAFRRNIQMVFQNPISSFSPRMTIGDYLWEPLRNYEKRSRAQALPVIKEYLEAVGLSMEFADRYPHELSGGQLQRIAIARAVIIRPKLIVCDEATSALDVSIQKQIMELLKRFQKEKQISYLFIGHDLAVVQKISQRIAVMYLGEIVEVLESDKLLKQAAHPYTKALQKAVFDVYDPQEDKELLQGDPPDMQMILTGCSFASRCSECTDRCLQEKPMLHKIAGEHYVACHKVLIDEKGEH